MNSPFEAPGADLVLTGSFERLTEGGARLCKHIGLGVVNGVECEHLAFREAAKPTGRSGSRSGAGRSRANTSSPTRPSDGSTSIYAAHPGLADRRRRPRRSHSGRRKVRRRLPRMRSHISMRFHPAWFRGRRQIVMQPQNLLMRLRWRPRFGAVTLLLSETSPVSTRMPRWSRPPRRGSSPRRR